jgi:putative glycosyltransferase (TIGR04372 family)
MKKNYIKNITILFQIIALFPVIVFIVCIYPIIKIKIFLIETRAIGHFTLPVEIFLSELKLKKSQEKRTFYIWFPNKVISNRFLYEKWKEILSIFPRIIFEPIFYFFRKIPYGNSFLIQTRHWTDYHSWEKKNNHNDIYNALNQTKPNIIFSNKEIQEGNEYLKKYGLTNLDNYICIAFRNPSYYYNQKIITKFRNSLRDSNLDNFTKAAEFLLKKNYKIFALGERNPIQKYPAGIIQYNNSAYKNDFLDIFLPFHCSYFLSSATGIDSVARLNRKKRYILNFSQISFLWSMEDVELFIPKKFKLLSTGKFIPYSEVLRLNLSHYHYLSDLNKDGYDCVSNSEEEIFSAIREIDFFYKEKKYLSDEMDYLNKKFRSIYKDYCGYEIKRVKICDSFLKINKDLIN